MPSSWGPPVPYGAAQSGRGCAAPEPAESRAASRLSASRSCGDLLQPPDWPDARPAASWRRMTRQPLSRRALPFLLLTGPAAAAERLRPVPADTPEGMALVAQLRAGGLVLF